MKNSTKKAVEAIVVAADTDGISCDGGGTTGHPKVWYSFDGINTLACNYCGRVFTKST